MNIFFEFALLFIFSSFVADCQIISKTDNQQLVMMDRVNNLKSSELSAPGQSKDTGPGWH